MACILHRFTIQIINSVYEVESSWEMKSFSSVCPLMKPLLKIRAGVHWWKTFNCHHCDKNFIHIRTTWECMKGFQLKKIHSTANTVIRNLSRRTTWECMKGLTLKNNHSTANTLKALTLWAIQFMLIIIAQLILLLLK